MPSGANPTAFATPCPRGPVVISTPAISPYSGCPAVFAPNCLNSLKSSKDTSYPQRYRGSRLEKMHVLQRRLTYLLFNPFWDFFWDLCLLECSLKNLTHKYPGQRTPNLGSPPLGVVPRKVFGLFLPTQ